MTVSVIYTDLVPSWNSEKPKYMAFLRMILKMADDMRVCLDSFLHHFDLDTAVGQQLDIIGILLGASRILPFSPSAGSRELNDDDYRMCLKARIAANTWDGSNEHAMQLYADVFSVLDLQLVDNQDCSMNITIRGTFTDLQLEMMQRGYLIPHPAGVRITYDIPKTINPTSNVIQTGVYQTGKIDVLSAGEYTGG